MCTKCVLTVPLTKIDEDLSINMKKVNGVMRGMMCTKCVLTVPLTTIDPDLPMNMKKVNGLIRGRCIRNVYRPFLLLK